METANSARKAVRAGRMAVILAAWALAASAPRLCAQTADAPAAPAAPPTAQHPSGSEPGQYWLELAQLNQRYGMTDNAQKYYSNAVENAKGPQIKVQALASWGEMLDQQKQPAEAAAKFAKAMTLAEDSPTKWRLGQALAHDLEATGKNDEASALYQTLMKIPAQPGEREWARDRLFDLYRRLEKLEELTRIFEALASADPQDSLALQSLVWIYRDWKQDLKAARTAAMKLVALRNDDPQANLQLADIEVRLKNTDRAIEIYEKLAQMRPAQQATCYDRISGVYFSIDQKEKGLEWAEKAANVEPQSAGAWVHFGDICCGYGQAAKSLSAYTKADSLAQTEGDHDTVKLHQANALRGLKRDDEAIAIYKGLFDKPNSPVREQAKRELFELYSQKGMLDKVKLDAAGTPPPAK